jgi:hypothetical protein
VTFLHPLVLLGLAAAAIPTLLHLFERRTPPEVEFPPLRYLSEAERESARRLKLRHLLLLLLRTALIALVVLAAARPVVPARAGGAHEPTALAVILDNSPSSGVVVDGRPLLDRLRAVAHSSLAAAGPEDRLWLLLADGVPRRGSRPALLAAVERVEVSARRLDLREAVERAARIVDAEPVLAREVHLVSDLQRTALGSGGPDLPRGVRLLVLAPSAEPPPNRGIGPARVADGAVAVTVVGTPGTSPGAVTVRLRGRTVGRALAAPGSGISVPLPPLGPGWWVGEAVLDADELRADDRRLFVWRVTQPARVWTAPDVGPFVTAAVAVLREGRRVGEGTELQIGGRPGSGPGVVFPPADRALLGEMNRALATRGGEWRYGAPGTPGLIVAPQSNDIRGIPVARRYRLEGRDTAGVLATVNGEPWLVRDGDIVLLGSRLDTAWTSLPATTGFVPFVDALVNQVVRGEEPARMAEGAVGVEFQIRGADTVGATVSGPDPRESDLTPATPDLAQRALGAPVLDDAAFAAAGFAGARRADVSGVLLLLALLVAVAELGLATLTH